MSTSITVDLGGAVPPYEQIRRQISSLIAIGELTTGQRLPTVRALAADLGVAVGTVTRAYRELESAGLIESRRRLGTVVAQPPAAGAAGPGPMAPSHRSGTPLIRDVSEHPALQAALDAVATAAAGTAFDDETVVDLLRGRLMQAKKSSEKP